MLFTKSMEQSLPGMGDDLMQIGLVLGGNYIGRAQDYWGRSMPGDFSSQLYHLQKIDKSEDDG